MVDNRRHGALRDRVHFQMRGTTGDGWGNTVPGNAFTTQFTTDVNLTARLGGETVVAARMQGAQPYILTARWAENTIKVSVGWQLVDVKDATRIFNVVSPPVDPDGKRQWIEMLVTSGPPS